jgi:hypothetical protein
MNAHDAVFFPALGDKKLELGPEEFGTNTCKVKWHRSLQGISVQQNSEIGFRRSLWNFSIEFSYLTSITTCACLV